MASRKVFVSYSHAQKEWVRDRLIPCLDAAGVEVLADYRNFGAGRPLPAQMDSLVDQADLSLLVISGEYLASAYCRREMCRAIGRDAGLEGGHVVPVLRQKCLLPAELAAADPLCVDLEDDALAEGWEAVLEVAAGRNLGVAAPEWLAIRDAAVRHLLDRRSISLELRGEVEWKGLVANIRQKVVSMKEVDLARGVTVSRRGLVEVILNEAGAPRSVPPPPDDLGALDLGLSSLRHTHLGLHHFHLAAERRAEYDANFFDAFRSLMEAGHLTVLFTSRRPFLDLVPAGHPLSRISSLVTLRLEAA